MTAIFSALTTTTKSPVSTCGVYWGLRLPRRVSAICVASRPERLALGIDDVPVALDLARLCVPGLLHDKKRRTTSPPSAAILPTIRPLTCAGARSLARKTAGARASSVAPIASAVTPSTSSATPPRSASAAPVSPARRSFKPSSLPRSAGPVASASCAVAETNERFQPSPRPKSRTAVIGTLSTQISPMHETAMIASPPTERRPASDPVDQPADDEDERVHAEHVRADDREDDPCAWCGGRRRRSRSGSSPRP